MSTTPLQDLQYEIGDVIIGSGTPYPVGRVDGFGVTAIRAVEYPNPLEDGRSFGREKREGRELVFEGSVVKAGDPEGAWDLQELLADAFDAEEVRSTSRAVMPMRLRRPGKPTRVVFGRPDKYDPETQQAVYGFIPWSGTFRCSDRLYYSDTEHHVSLSILSQAKGHIIVSPSGGLMSPIRTTAPGERATTIRNEGTAATWPTIDISGPILDPYVALNGPDGELWRLAVEGPVAYDQTVTIDTRPWSRGASQNGGPLVGRISPAHSSPSQASLPRGTYDLQVGGVDVTGTAKFDIRWRDAYRNV
jgi:hypothetical protein